MLPWRRRGEGNLRLPGSWHAAGHSLCQKKTHFLVFGETMCAVSGAALLASDTQAAAAAAADSRVEAARLRWAFFFYFGNFFTNTFLNPKSLDTVRTGLFFFFFLKSYLNLV